MAMVRASTIVGCTEIFHGKGQKLGRHQWSGSCVQGLCYGRFVADKSYVSSEYLTDKHFN